MLVPWFESQPAVFLPKSCLLRLSIKQVKLMDGCGLGCMCVSVDICLSMYSIYSGHSACIKHSSSGVILLQLFPFFFCFFSRNRPVGFAPRPNLTEINGITSREIKNFEASVEKKHSPHKKKRKKKLLRLARS